MALPMTLIIIAGEIDLSVESMAGLASAILGFLWAAGVPLEIAHPRRPRRRRPRRAAQRPARGARRPAVAGRDPRHAGPVPRPGADRPRPARRQRLPARLHRARLRPRARDADPVAVRHLHRPGPRARHRPAPDVDRPPGLRHRQEHRRRPLLRRPRRAAPDRPVRAVRPGRGAGRRDPDLPPLERPRRCRHRA